MSAVVACGLVFLAGIACAEETRSFEFDIPRQDVESALDALAMQVEALLLFPYEPVQPETSNPVVGRYSVNEALEILLKGTQLKGGFTPGGVITISQDVPVAGQLESEGEEVKMNKKGLAAVLAAVFAAPSVSAQAPDNEGSSEHLEEIIVTATLREENINDTAMSIVAVGSEEIERRNLTEMNDFLRTTPGVNFIDLGVGSKNAVVIRGLALDPQQEGVQSSPTVGIYFGDVSLTGLGLLGGSPNIKMIDLDRVEVLRGPQGTLFGANSLAGTVRNIPNMPNLADWEGTAKAGYSNTAAEGSHNTNVQGVVNIPVVEDVLAVRAVGYHFDESGFIRNIAGTQLLTGGEARPGALVADDAAAFNSADLFQDVNDIGAISHSGGRIAIRFRPIEDLDITLTSLYQESTQSGNPYVQINTGGYTQVSQQLGNRVEELLDETEGFRDRVRLTNLLVEYDLKSGVIRSSTAWGEDESQSISELSSFVFGLPVVQRYQISGEIFSQELRFVSDFDGPVQVIVGGYYEDIDNEFDARIWATGDPATNFFGEPFGAGNPLVNSENILRPVEQTSFYGEVSYDITDQLALTGGFRHYDYERNLTTTNAGVLGGVDAENTVEEKGTNFKANLSYRPGEGRLVYAQWAEGFRLGNGNLGIAPATCDVNGDGILDGTSAPLDPSFDSDSTDNLEFGTKLSLADDRLQLNAALYRIDWSDIPLRVFAGALPGQTQTCFTGTVVNGGSARSQGFELETSFQVSDNFRIDLAGAYTSAELTEDFLEAGGFDGDRLPSSPESNITVGGLLEFDLRGNPAYLDVEYSYVGEYFNRLGEAGDKAGGYGQLNLTVGTEIENVTVDFFGYNLTNEDSLVAVDVVVPDTRATRIRPRTVGVNLSVQF